MKTIALLGLYYDNNLGDPLIFECVEYMYRKFTLKKNIELNFQYIDLFGRTSPEELTVCKGQGFMKKQMGFAFKIIKIIINKISPQTLEFLHDIQFKIAYKNRKQLQLYFTNKLKGCDMLVIVGGALVKYRIIRDLHNPMYTLTKIAEDLKIPMYFNAVGIENGYNINLYGCKTVKKYLNSCNVKKITTRDDIETLYKYIDNSNIIVNKSADTAVWCDEIFHVKSNDTSCTIGVGVIEPARFVQYEQGITEEFYENWIFELLQLMDENHMEWMLFTNGHKGDYEFALKTMKRMNLSKDRLIIRPKDYRELIGTINSFKIVVASRLHACIIAYSLNKLIIGIDWNDKLMFFGKDIELSKNFFKPSEKTPAEAINLIEAAMSFQYDPKLRNEYRESVLKSIEQSLEFIS